MLKIGNLVLGCKPSFASEELQNDAYVIVRRFWGSEKVEIAAIQILPVTVSTQQTSMTFVLTRYHLARE